jgi:3-hydroxybutyryl-CoA dehydratase
VSVLERDFDALAVGDAFVTRGRTVTEADVVAFAALTGDRHPLHVDAEWAAASPFGARIAHGLLVLSYGAGLLPFDPERVIALRAVREAVFKRPVHIGDTIRLEAEVAGKRALDPERGLVEARWRVLDQDDRLSMRATVELLWRRGA